VNHSDCCSGVDVEEAAVTQSSGEGRRAEKCSVQRGSRIAAAAAMRGSDSQPCLGIGVVDKCGWLIGISKTLCAYQKLASLSCLYQ